MSTKLTLVGAGGHAAVVSDALDQSLVSVVDTNPELEGANLLEFPIQFVADLSSLDFEAFHVAIGDNRIRAEIQLKLLATGGEAISVIHERSVVSRHSQIGAGSFVAAHAVIAARTSIGEGVIVNHCAVIDHDCIVGNFCHVAPSATLGGGVRVGRGSLVGSGANVLPGVKIGKNVKIGAGAVVIRDVEPGCEIAGVPARVISKG